MSINSRNNSIGSVESSNLFYMDMSIANKRKQHRSPSVGAHSSSPVGFPQVCTTSTTTITTTATAATAPISNTAYTPTPTSNRTCEANSTKRTTMTAASPPQLSASDVSSLITRLSHGNNEIQENAGS